MEQFNESLQSHSDLQAKLPIWFEKAGKGDMKANFNLGIYFRSEKIVGEAGCRFEPAADQGLVEAQFNLAYMIIKEKIDYKKVVRHDIAVKYLLNAAEKNHKWATFYLGSAHMTGEGVEKDPVKGLRYFEKAAALELPEGAVSARLCHTLGIGTSQNPEKAFEYI